jgi:hypothetical protein
MLGVQLEGIGVYPQGETQLPQQHANQTIHPYIQASGITIGVLHTQAPV